MNRRDFLRLAGVGLAGLLLPKMIGEMKMITNKLGDIMLELRDPNLSPNRLEEIQRIFNELGDREEKYKSWLSVQGNNPVVNTIKAESGEFKIPPVGGLSLYGGGGLSVEISTHTPIPFTINFNKTNTSMLEVSSVDNTKLLLRNKFKARGSTLIACGSVNWAASRSCAVRVEQYDSSDAPILDSIFSMAFYTAVVQPFIYAFTISQD